MESLDEKILDNSFLDKFVEHSQYIRKNLRNSLGVVVLSAGLFCAVSLHNEPNLSNPEVQKELIKTYIGFGSAIGGGYFISRLWKKYITPHMPDTDN